ncbi:hypothetical protein [Marinobacter shengliensis]|uniref:hypothetical protein n=1 Tax=Marinobacter shengliensis TaxID=1389223 RepID=UPI001108A3C2|nr:hypothetical protein [Marinobacter shengliensis]
MGLSSPVNLIESLGRYELHGSARLELPAHASPGAQYVRVYIRMDTAIYRKNAGHPGWLNDLDRETFDADMAKVLSEANLIVDGSYARSFGDVPEQLYIHPDHLNGVVSLERLAAVVEALKSSHVSKCRWLDIYTFLEQLDDEEKLKRLRASEPAMIRAIAKAMNTGKRRAYRDLRFFDEYGLADTISGLQFVEHYSRGMGSCPVSRRFLQELLDRMVREGVLFTGRKDNMDFYRTPLKTELKAIPKAQRSESWDIVAKVLWSEPA